MARQMCRILCHLQYLCRTFRHNPDHNSSEILLCFNKFLHNIAYTIIYKSENIVSRVIILRISRKFHHCSSRSITVYGDVAIYISINR